MRVKGKASAVTIYTPLAPSVSLSPAQAEELRGWSLALKAWRAQNWDACDVHLLNLQRQNAEKVLYRLYAERVASSRQQPPRPAWDGTTTFDTK